MVEPQPAHRPASLSMGFGCASLGGDLTIAAQRALVEAAFEAGFRYFDVAPSYGHGSAERVVGDVLADVRDQVVIATKVGIVHPRSAGSLLFARRLLRPLKGLAPGLWGSAAALARNASAPRGQFGTAVLESTLRESLRRLRTQRIDHLLLHQATAPDIDASLLERLRNWQRDGIIASFGLGTSVEATGDIVAAHPGVFSIAQFDHYWGAFGGTALGIITVTHRCLRSGLALVQDPRLQHALAEHVHGDLVRGLLADRDTAPELLLRAGLRALPQGRLLVSSSDSRRVRAFARWAATPALVPEVDALDACLRRIAIPGTTLNAAGPGSRFTATSSMYS